MHSYWGIYFEVKYDAVWLSSVEIHDTWSISFRLLPFNHTFNEQKHEK